jgi:hypothetical protein
MKQKKRHSLTLAWPEESGQGLSIVQGGTSVGIFQRSTADVLTRGKESTRLMRPLALVLVFVFSF